MKTETTIDFYGKSSSIESFCVSINFYRPTNSAPVFINGFPVEEGRSLEIGQNVGDIDTTRYQITFGDGGGKPNELFVSRIIPCDSDG